mgnify:CR=1 FL=1
MRTGEGKTLVATLPAYLNALTGKGVHVVTVNEYLARRDSEDMGRVFKFLGLSVGLLRMRLIIRTAKLLMLLILPMALITSSVLIICVIIWSLTKIKWYNGL